MTSDVVLTAALRQNLLSLQSTQSSIDKTQFALATGKKVNSALDNPQNFFASRSLNNKANDLSRLLDGIGQSISAIENADNAVTAITTLVEQADSIATQARDALSAGQQEAKITGSSSLSGADDLTTLTGIDDDDQIVINYIDTDGDIAAAPVTVSVGTTGSIDQLITDINAIRDTGDNAVFEAKLDDAGQLSIRDLNGNRFEIDFQTSGGGADQSFANALGFTDLNVDVTDQTGAAVTKITVSATAALTSVALEDNATGLDAVRTTALTDLRNADGTVLFEGTGGEADTIDISINGSSTTYTIVGDIGNATVQDFVDGVNTDAALSQLIEASFDESTGQISIRAVDATVNSIEFAVTDAGATADGRANLQALGFGLVDLDADAADTFSESIQLGAAASELADLEVEYENVRTQIDQLVADAGFRGTNLLNGDDLITYFNSDQTSSLTSEGVTFTSAGLGLSEANFGRSETVSSAINDIREALTSVRSFGGTLANDLSIIQTRQDFTKNTINNLTSASDKLTLADANEEGTKLLALQTRQQLGVTSLSLAAQSQQSVLRLF